MQHDRLCPHSLVFASEHERQRQVQLQAIERAVQLDWVAWAVFVCNVRDGFLGSASCILLAHVLMQGDARG